MSNLRGLRVALRVDASLEIGTGHVMRCLTLANALADAGAQCLFISRELPGNLIDHLVHSGHRVHALPFVDIEDQLETTCNSPPHAPWLKCDWNTDAHQTSRAIQQEFSNHVQIDWIVVDSYALDKRWESALHPLSRRMLVIDDLADRAHDCDLLIDQSVGRHPDAYTELVRPACCTLIGPKFALLRPEFRQQRQNSLARRHSPELHHLLISMGGVDSLNATGQTLDGLSNCTLPPNCDIRVVIGPKFPWFAAVQQASSRLPWAVTLLTDVNDMASVMVTSDLVIGAAGTSALERCCLGVPSLLVVLASNQEYGAAALHTLGAAQLIGPLKLLTQNLPTALAHASDSRNLLRMTEAASSVTDGTGILRVLDHVSELS